MGTIVAGSFMPPYSAAVAGLLLDINPNAAFAYSFRKLRTTYAGSAVRIRRSSDNAEQDIGFVSNNFDIASATTFIGGGSGFLTAWYDQSGNGLNITQATAGAQPIYSATGLVGGPAAQFDGVDDLLFTASPINLSTFLSTNCTVLVVLQQDGTNATNNVFAWTGTTFGTTFVLHATYSDVIYFDLGTNGVNGRINVAQPAGWDDNPHILECYRDSGDVQGIVVDGVSLITGTRTDDIVSETGNIGFGSGATALLKGLLTEIVIWGTDLG